VSRRNAAGNVHRARHSLNADTIREMHAAFQQGGREAIDKVMKNSPAIFLKLLVLLVPREMKVEHSGGVKAMTDEQLEQGIEAIQAMLAARDAGSNAKVIEGETVPDAPKPRRTRVIPPAKSKAEMRRRVMRKAKRVPNVTPTLPPDDDAKLGDGQD
jgi:hypothetical protein